MTSLGWEMACPHNSRSILRIFVKFCLVQEVHESYISVSSGKFLFWAANEPLLGPKMARTPNSGSALRIFCKFCTMTGAKKYMKTVLMVSFRAIGPFWAQKMTWTYNSGSAFLNFAEWKWSRVSIAAISSTRYFLAAYQLYYSICSTGTLFIYRRKTLNCKLGIWMKKNNKNNNNNNIIIILITSL